MKALLDEIHPGEILLEDFMRPMGITARKLAADGYSQDGIQAFSRWVWNLFYAEYVLLPLV